MLNATKPVHLNFVLDATAAAGEFGGLGAAGATTAAGSYVYERVGPTGTVIALKIPIPGMASSGNTTPGRKATSIWIRNMATAATDTVLISFDNGYTFMTIQAAVAAAGKWDTFQANISFRYFYVRAGANTPSVECIVGINQS